MKNPSRLPVLALVSFVLLLSASQLVFGAQNSQATPDKEPYALFVSASKAHHAGSYRYAGTVNTEITTAILEERRTQKETVTLITTAKNKYSSYTAAVGKAGETEILSESVLQGGKLYIRTFQEGAEKPKWRLAKAENLLQGDIVSRILSYANSKGVSGLTYSFGKSVPINGTVYPQVVVGMDASFVQEIMAPITDALVESLLEATGAGQVKDMDKSSLAILTAGIYKSMTTDMVAGCVIEPNTSRFLSMTVSGSAQMHFLGMELTITLSGDFMFNELTEPVSLPIIRDEDILK